ncbi:hypothetical protein BC629DRAFT_1442750 [Irpex lacteus]|nr:hypothetical protein BC629DRAFT_1442750 [Irpex lacteus]
MFKFFRDNGGEDELDAEPPALQMAIGRFDRERLVFFDLDTDRHDRKDLGRLTLPREIFRHVKSWRRYELSTSRQATPRVRWQGLSKRRVLYAIQQPLWPDLWEHISCTAEELRRTSRSGRLLQLSSIRDHVYMQEIQLYSIKHDVKAMSFAIVSAKSNIWTSPDDDQSSTKLIHVAMRHPQAHLTYVISVARSARFNISLPSPTPHISHGMYFKQFVYGKSSTDVQNVERQATQEPLL